MVLHNTCQHQKITYSTFMKNMVILKVLYYYCETQGSMNKYVYY